MIWYHGTSNKNAKTIYRAGCFKAGTWFARHLEDAVEFGGPYVFAVRVRFKTRKWQVCCLNKILIDRVAEIYLVLQGKESIV